MIDTDIETHVLSQCATAYPTLDEDQFICKIIGGNAGLDQSTINQRNDSGSYAVYETTVNVILNIQSGSKVNRDTLIRLFPRKWIQFDDQKVFQMYQRWVNADLVEVINMKGIIHYIDYSYIVYSS